MRDLQTLHGVAPGTRTHVTISPKAVEGQTRMATRFASLFMRDYNVNTGLGTGFLNAFKTGKIRNSPQLITWFSLSRVDAIHQMDNQADLPASDRIVGAELVAHSFSGNNLSMRVQLITAADQTVTVEVQI